MATWRNGYAEDCKSCSLFTHTLIIPYKLTYLFLIQTARTLLCHSCATLSFETVERSFYLQSPTKVSYETSLVPSEHSFGTSYLRDLVFNRGTSSDIKFDGYKKAIHPLNKKGSQQLTSLCLIQTVSLFKNIMGFKWLAWKNYKKKL